MVPAGEEPVMAGILPTSSRHGGRSRTLRAHILNHKDKTEPMPGDILLSTKPHLLTLPNSIINWGSLWGTFKLPQTQTRRSWWSGVAGDTDLRFSLLLRLPFPRNLYHLANVYREGLWSPFASIPLTYSREKLKTLDVFIIDEGKANGEVGRNQESVSKDVGYVSLSALPQLLACLEVIPSYSSASFKIEQHPPTPPLREKDFFPTAWDPPYQILCPICKSVSTNN